MVYILFSCYLSKTCLIQCIISYDLWEVLTCFLFKWSHPQLSWIVLDLPNPGITCLLFNCMKIWVKNAKMYYVVYQEKGKEETHIWGWNKVFWNYIVELPYIWKYMLHRSKLIQYCWVSKQCHLAFYVLRHHKALPKSKQKEYKVLALLIWADPVCKWIMV